jgi:hypothetical protein
MRSADLTLENRCEMDRTVRSARRARIQIRPGRGDFADVDFSLRIWLKIEDRGTRFIGPFVSRLQCIQDAQARVWSPTTIPFAYGYDRDATKDEEGPWDREENEEIGTAIGIAGPEDGIGIAGPEDGIGIAKDAIGTGMSGGPGAETPVAVESSPPVKERADFVTETAINRSTSAVERGIAGADGAAAAVSKARGRCS